MDNIQTVGYSTDKTKKFFQDKDKKETRKTKTLGFGSVVLDKLNVLGRGIKEVFAEDESIADKNASATTGALSVVKVNPQPEAPVIVNETAEKVANVQSPGRRLMTPVEADDAVPFVELETESHPALKELFENLQQGMKNREQMEDSLNNLCRKNKSARTKHTLVSEEDSITLYQFIMAIYVIIRANEFRELDKNDPKSIEILREKFSYAPGVDETTQPQLKFQKEALHMMQVSIENKKTAGEVDNFVADHNGAKYFPYTFAEVDLHTKDFTADWIAMIAQRMAEISKEDIAPYLVDPKQNDLPADVNEKNIEAEKIINRLMLTPEESNKFLVQFLPKLEQNIKFLHSHALENEENANFVTQGLKIKKNLQAKQTKNTEIIAKLSEKKQEVITPEKPKMPAEEREAEAPADSETKTTQPNAGDSVSEKAEEITAPESTVEKEKSAANISEEGAKLLMNQINAFDKKNILTEEDKIAIIEKHKMEDGSYKNIFYGDVSEAIRERQKAI